MGDHSKYGFTVMAAFGSVALFHWWNRSKEKSVATVLLERLGRMHTEESRNNGLTFTPRPTDIFVVTYPKCGTTWVQQICHGLRTGGDMDFDEITAVTPWTICAMDCKVDINANQVASPRVFKCHEQYSDVAKGAKYIYVMRDPQDVLVSFHKFVLDYCGLGGQMTVDEFAHLIYLGSGTNSGTYWDHIMGWFPHFHDDNVLVLFFEDLKTDLPKCIQKIADFMDIQCDDKLLSLITTQSSFKFMVKHKEQFDGHYLRKYVAPRMGIADIEPTIGKVRVGGGRSGDGKKELPATLIDAVNRRWKETITEKQPTLLSYANLYNSESLLKRS